MKKILAIAPYSYLPYFSGGQKFIAEFLQHLGNATELTVVTVAENDFTLAGNYKTLPLLKKSFRRYMDRSLISKVEEVIRKEKTEILICEHPYFAWLAFSLKRKTGVKVIIHTHNIEYQRFRSANRWWWPILKNYEKRSFKKADAILFISPEDKDFAINKWKIEKQKCIDMPYGIDRFSAPSDKQKKNLEVKQKHSVAQSDKILLFAGLLNYKPNADAVNMIVGKIAPRLDASCKIIICGKGLNEDLTRKINESPSIIYAGFVENIEIYFAGADIFLNPILSGGGVKTKIIEAIASGTTVVSTMTGATGMERPVCGEKLIIVNDDDWVDFSKKIEEADTKKETPRAFFEHYNYSNSISRLLSQLELLD
jgi:glycosyltransferase involved in cell wall biosynthesis